MGGNGAVSGVGVGGRMEGHLTDSMIRIMVNICDDLEG